MSQPIPASATLKELKRGTPEWDAAVGQARLEQPEMWEDRPIKKRRGWRARAPEPSMVECGECGELFLAKGRGSYLAKSCSDKCRAVRQRRLKSERTDMQTTHKQEDEMSTITPFKSTDATCTKCHTGFRYVKKGPARSVCDACKESPRKKRAKAPAEPAPVADPDQGNTVYDGLSRGDLIAKLEQQAGEVLGLSARLEARTAALERTEAARVKLFEALHKSACERTEMGSQLSEWRLWACVVHRSRELDDAHSRQLISAKVEALHGEVDKCNARRRELEVIIEALEREGDVVFTIGEPIKALDVDSAPAELVVERLGLLHGAGALSPAEYVRHVLELTTRQTGIALEVEA